MTRDRHPLVIFILTACILSSLRILLGGPAPASVQASLATWQLNTWAALLGLGSVVTLAGIGMRRSTGLFVEQVGLVTLAGAAFVYALAVLSYTGATGVLPAATTLWFSGCCLHRAWTIQRAVHHADRR